MQQNENASFLQILKRIAKEERESADLCDFIIGTVTSANPLKIKVSQKIELDEDFLVLSRNVTDYNTDVSLDVDTDSVSIAHTHDVVGATQSAGGSHSHKVKGRITVTVHNALKKGEKVLLAMESGGQTYYVIDRVVI